MLGPVSSLGSWCGIAFCRGSGLLVHGNELGTGRPRKAPEWQSLEWASGPQLVAIIIDLGLTMKMAAPNLGCAGESLKLRP